MTVKEITMIMGEKGKSGRGGKLQGSGMMGKEEISLDEGNKWLQVLARKYFNQDNIQHMSLIGKEKHFKTKIDSALKSALKKPKQAKMKLPFGLCGCQEENIRGQEIVETNNETDEQSNGNGALKLNPKFQLLVPLPESSYILSIDEWHTIRSGGDEIGKWLVFITSDLLWYSTNYNSWETRPRLLRCDCGTNSFVDLLIKIVGLVL
ncbi:hypothetical protein NE237_015408 [Protea cynaroides]|uniref:Uncharacterized protein n=1 Tax=Protea cynaroides TaxID=273540 RepID=A0A9Q0KDY6_9MAGN|nr:hypothetical protein NE237_015408 [Protea cynaroides]